MRSWRRRLQPSRRRSVEDDPYHGTYVSTTVANAVGRCVFLAVVEAAVLHVIGVVGRVVNPVGDIVPPLLDVLPGAPSRSAKRPRAELIGNHPVVDLVLTTLPAVDDGMPLVGRVLTHGVVVLVIAKFSAVCIVLVETVAGDGGDDFNAGRLWRHGEIQLSSVFCFVVVGAVKLTPAEGVRGVDRSGSASPVAEQECHGQIAFVRTGVLESAILPVVEHEQVGRDVREPHAFSAVGRDPSNRLGVADGIVVPVANEEVSEVIPLMATAVRAVGLLVPIGSLVACMLVVNLQGVVGGEVVW